MSTEVEREPSAEAGESPQVRDAELHRGPALWVQHAGAFAGYLAIWLAAMLPKVGVHLSERVLGRVPQEVAPIVWSLEWWSRGLTFTSNPLYTNSVWAPTGLNLAWVPTLPGPGLITAPLTRLFGPNVSFNILVLLAAPLAAWTAYLLIRRVTGLFWASLAGGFLFGFSPYVTREIAQGHLNLSLVFLIPLMAYLIVRRLDGTMGRVAFVLLLTAVLVGEFTIFTEIFATMALITFLVAIGALLLAPPAMRSRLLQTTGLVALSFALAGVVMAPYLWTAFAYANAAKPHGFGGLAVGLRGPRDVLRFAFPGRWMAINFGIHWGYNFWYFGIPLLAVLAAFWFRNRRSFAVRVLALAFFVAIVLSLGPNITIRHHEIPLPWSVFSHLPLIGRARAGRIVVYAFLVAALSAAMWLAQPKGRTRGAVFRWAVIILAMTMFVPNVWSAKWTRDATMPAFFSTGQYRQYLCQDEIVMVVDRGPSREVYWQAGTGMYFRTVTWYLGFRPKDYVDLRTAINLLRGKVKPDDGPLVQRFVAEHGVTSIIVGRAPRESIDLLASALGVTPEPVGGVTLMRLAPCSPASQS